VFEISLFLSIEPIPDFRRQIVVFRVAIAIPRSFKAL
jgi:hypothetical protein